ncbi:DUF29 domain-containing protein [Symplocastrum sp. BBK-W-15]|uniref:DUF29 domain-containing protein n=2 Tax=Limnofasciculus TaxID=3064905 RepID=A0AAE3KVB9_9CYAN|nr:DUF29 domain-containing protein [Limnofasciculus baicalensis]MCP2732437.1 DUF29 domain-containing protein [Limnofasciculus baicalensis BBK-W-15]
MKTELQTSQKSLYETDFICWVETTLAQLRAQDYGNVDWQNLFEEIEDMSKRERKSLKSNLVVLLLYLLKWQYQPESRSGSWRGAIREHRRRINDDLKDSPSLKPYLKEIFYECYQNARQQAADETGLLLKTFPIDSLYTEEQVLDTSFLPE